MNARANTYRSDQLAAFIEKVMEPLPDAVLVDGRYRRQLRDERRSNYVRAEARVKCFAALLDLAEYTDQESWYCVRDSPVRSQHARSHYVALYRQAVADLLLTPANYTANVAWKRRQNLEHLPVDPAAVAAAIEADERFLRDNSPRRR